ncbi:MAG: phenylalanine--tRNA ligase subunit beta [bacterium]|nr:phenylalanine--tRNA ligase subunit beta [bacterium]
MKFSYALIKKLVPGVKSKKELIEKLNLHSFEVEDAEGDVFDVSVPPNRFSDAGSHMGIARELSAIYRKFFKEPKITLLKSYIKKRVPVVLKTPLCFRMSACYFGELHIGPSPKWMQKILIDCGLRSINNLVDITNYVTIETGQPLHAFDFDKMEGGQLIIRNAKDGEKVELLDGVEVFLKSDIAVLADLKGALDIAGIKGGKKAEISKKTKNILLTSGNFDGVSIYKASRKTKISTDASLRFSHDISPELASIGINRAGELIKKLCGGKPGILVDIYPEKQRKKIIKFDLEKFNKFIGLDLDSQTIKNYLNLLGFQFPRQSASSSRSSAFLVEVPPLRQDIETFEDLAEEIARLYGYDKIKSTPALIRLIPSGFEDQIILKDKIRKILSGMGLSEVYNYSFISQTDADNMQTNVDSPRWSALSPRKSALVELENPISAQFKYLRPSLASHLLENIKSNSRFFDEIKIFEIGKVFDKTEEKLILGIAMASKNNPPAGGDEMFFEAKGVIERLFKKIGLVDFLMKESRSGNLEIKSGDKIIGFINHLEYKGILAEIDLDSLLELVVEEREYRPLPKYPSIMRDISILVEQTARVGEIMQAIQEIDLEYIEDVDLMDEYDLIADQRGKGLRKSALSRRESAVRRSLTFRIVFQAEDRTLTDDEANKEMEKISKMLKIKFKAIIR